MLLKNKVKNLRPEFLVNHLNVRKASPDDLEEIYNVASSVGSSEKDPEQGFLVDDYVSNPNYYLNFLKDKLEILENFYVAEYDKIYGFLMAYNKEEWLYYNPEWVDAVFWKPDFDRSALNSFIVVDKTAVSANLTGFGIGSVLYKYLLEDLKSQGVKNIFAETIISPKPNFASLQFRRKQAYELAGVRYETYLNNSYTDLIYHKPVI